MKWTFLLQTWNLWFRNISQLFSTGGERANASHPRLERQKRIASWNEQIKG